VTTGGTAALRLARVHFPVTTLGPGRRLGIWLQGCGIGCPGCMSRDTWAAGGGNLVAVDDLLAWCAGRDRARVTGVTITGGEPSEQPGALAALVAGLARLGERHGWDLLCYTGVEEDEFARRCPEAYATVDALVTGPYLVARPTDLIWRGSANQRLVPLTPRGHDRYKSYLDFQGDRPAMQVDVRDGRVRLVGVPRAGDLTRMERLLAARGIRLEGVSWRP
jgi:anaerobic ribonucleoside-triphosphate reductase activating protein